MKTFLLIFAIFTTISAVKIDRDQNLAAGFYDALFIAIRTLLNDSLRNLNNETCQKEKFIKNFKNKPLFEE